MYNCQTGWSRGNALDLYSRGARFEFHRGHLQFWLRYFVVFLSPSRNNTGILSRLCHKCFLPSPFPFISHPNIRHYNYSLGTESVVKNPRKNPCILCLGTRWEWTVSFTPQPLYPLGKRPRYPLYRGHGGPQGRSWRCEEKASVWRLATGWTTEGSEFESR
jgi:hypothetical protein